MGDKCERIDPATQEGIGEFSRRLHTAEMRARDAELAAAALLNRLGGHVVLSRDEVLRVGQATVRVRSLNSGGIEVTITEAHTKPAP